MIRNRFTYGPSYRWRKQAIAQPIPRTGGSLAGSLVQRRFIDSNPVLPTGSLRILELCCLQGVLILFLTVFFDRRLAEFAFALPERQRSHRGLVKIVLRNALQGRLPEPVIRRRVQTDFTPV